MYNKVKYITSMIGAILAIVLGSFILVTVLISLISLISSCAEASRLASSPNVTVRINGGAVFVVILGLGIRATLGAIILNFGIRTVGKPWLRTVDSKNNVKVWEYSSKGKDIALIVISGILFFLGVLVSLLDSSFGAGDITFVALGWATWIQNILCLGIMTLKIITISINGQTLEQQIETLKKQTQSQTVNNEAKVGAQNVDFEAKIKELKRLKDLNLITEEQYNKSVDKIMQKVAE